MKKQLYRATCTVLAALLLAAPAWAEPVVATPETGMTAAQVLDPRLPDDLTEEERAYTHIALYEPAVQDGTLALDTYALDAYNSANAATVYRFLTGSCGMNNAQAAGVMASIYTESRFEPSAYNPNDTGGTTSYGICQWNGARYDALRDWCAANGYEYTTLDGQLQYLQYEITGTWEKQVWSRTDSEGRCFGTAQNNSDGAWNAGYTWSRYYGRGAAAGWTRRGDLAQEFYASYSTVDVTQITAFVTRLYNVCLGRDPDPAGLQNWVDTLADRTQTGTQVAYGFVFSNEFKEKNYCNTDYTKQLYRAFLGREYDPAGLNSWVLQLQSGMTREQAFNGFAGSAEFAGLCAGYGIAVGSAVELPPYGTVPTGPCTVCGAEDGITSFVKRLYKTCLDREADAPGLKNWVKLLATHAQTGTQVAYGFVFSQEFTGKNYSDADYVKQLYRAFMDREYDAPGLKNWVDHLQGGMTRQEVFAGFAASAEFAGICQSYGITQGESD